jgi:hypothetical protein
MGQNRVKGANDTKVKVLSLGLHMTCVDFMLVYNFKICILGTFLTLHFKYIYILTTN